MANLTKDRATTKSAVAVLREQLVGNALAATVYYMGLLKVIDSAGRVADPSPAIATGGVTGIAVTAGGSGYTSAPAVVFTGGGGTGATATAVVGVGGVVSNIIITNSGTGYTTAPAISFTGGAGTGAAATATIALAVRAAGVVKDRVDNSLGAVDAVKVELETGVFRFDKHATTPPLTTDIGRICYGSDNHTISITPTDGPAVGRVWQVNAGSIDVNVGPLAL